jgi:hypothetical protein
MKGGTTENGVREIIFYGEGVPDCYSERMALSG